MRRLPLLTFLLASTVLLAACDEETGIRRAPYDLVSVPAQFDFGTVAVGSDTEATLIISNLGSGSAEIGNVTLGGGGGGNFLLPSSFSGNIEGGGSLDIAVLFAPQVPGYFNDTLILNVVNQDDSDVVEVQVRGHAVNAALRAWPEVLDFGPVEDGDEEERDLTVQNLTAVDVEVVSVSLGGEEQRFGVDEDDLPLVIPANGTADLPITYFSDGEPSEADISLLGPDGVDWGVNIDLIGNVCEDSADPAWDSDGDGFTPCGGDCDDDDETVHPGAPELPDLVDNNCNETTDEGTEIYDDDGDGFSEAEGDCNDDDPNSFPGADELADGRDNDCDGLVDEGTTSDDSDGDGYTIPAGDCDDTNAGVRPDAVELEDGVDNDCDGVIDEETSFFDDDGDGYCENATTCVGGFTPGDCNDGDANAFPGNPEVVNGADDDCDGIVDNGTDAFDNDGDGYTGLGGDCNDSDPTIYPGAAELPDLLDNDCDLVIDEGTVNADDDGDGFTELGGDCNDSDALIFPGADEDGYATEPFAGDGIDNDCDGVVDEQTTWYDDDGDGFSELGGDCDDQNAAVSPGIWDPPGGDDLDCDGTD